MARVYKRWRKDLRRVKGPKGKPLKGPDGKPLYEPTLNKFGHPKHKFSRVWYVGWTDADGKPRTRRAFASKRASMALAVQLQEQADMERQGLRDRTWTEQARPLAEHVEDFRDYLAARGNTPGHVEKTIHRIEAVVGGCKWNRLGDMRLEGTLGYLADRRAAGLSVGTTNGYLAALREFCRWIERTERAPRNPLPGLALQNAAADRRRVRRALSEDELAALLNAAEKGPPILGLAGPERAILYRLAVETGFRAAELRSLKIEDLDLDAATPTATIRAGYSKRRREDVQPLRRDFARRLRAWTDSLGRDRGPVVTVPERTAEMLRRDLKAAGIPEADMSGRVADFHSLRVVFGSRLARAGVHPKVA